MSGITYVDSNGDTITEYGDEHITVRHNPSGWRLIPGVCRPHIRARFNWPERPGCRRLVVWHVLQTGVGTSNTYCCDDHLPAKARAAVARTLDA